jgi:single-strand DNA-binding protein
MASFNRVVLIGRLTRDPEVRVFANGGKVAKFGFAVSGQRKKNPDTGQWEDEPCFLDVEAFNKGEYGKSADLVEEHLRKGKQCFIEGHLRMDSWTGRDGQKRNKIIVVADSLRFLEPKTPGNEPVVEPRRGTEGEELLLQTIAAQNAKDEIPF